jgi:hypothetical protein
MKRAAQLKSMFKMGEDLLPRPQMHIQSVTTRQRHNFTTKTYCLLHFSVKSSVVHLFNQVPHHEVLDSICRYSSMLSVKVKLSLYLTN